MADNKSLTARATMYKLVVVRSRTFLQSAEMQTSLFPDNDKMFKINNQQTYTKRITKRLRE